MGRSYGPESSSGHLDIRQGKIGLPRARGRVESVAQVLVACPAERKRPAFLHDPLRSGLLPAYEVRPEFALVAESFKWRA